MGYYRAYYAVCAVLALGLTGAALYGFGRLHGAAARDAWWTAAQAETQRALFRAADDLSVQALAVERERAALASDTDVVLYVALGIGVAVEWAYGLAKRKGWAT